MRDRLDDLEQEFGEVEARLADPTLIADQSRYGDVARRYRELEAIVIRYRELKAAEDDLATAREMFNEASSDDREVVRAEIDEAEAAIERLDAEIKLLLLPADPNDGQERHRRDPRRRGRRGGQPLRPRPVRDVPRPTRPGRAGRSRCSAPSPSDLGGFNEITFLVKGDGVWTRMKHEGGPHRVQRVPVTESPGPHPHLVGHRHRAARGRGGRRRTSTRTTSRSTCTGRRARVASR